MYKIIGENVFNNSQNIVLTSGIVTSMANIVVECILMKEKPNEVSHNFKFILWLHSHCLSTFVILLMKMALSFLMLLSMFPWIHKLTKNIKSTSMDGNATSSYFLYHCWFVKGNFLAL
jgi:hypothetical protein